MVRDVWYAVYFSETMQKESLVQKYNALLLRYLGLDACASVAQHYLGRVDCGFIAAPPPPNSAANTIAFIVSKSCGHWVFRAFLVIFLSPQATV